MNGDNRVVERIAAVLCKNEGKEKLYSNPRISCILPHKKSAFQAERQNQAIQDAEKYGRRLCKDDRG